MDIATYDREEAAASARLDAWQTRQVFGPGHFEHVGFHTRIGHLGELRGLLAGLHPINRVQWYMEELQGLDQEEIDILLRAMMRFVAWYRGIFPDTSMRIPMAEFVSQFAAYSKLRGLPSRRRVLEIGSGFGLTATFEAADPAIEQATFLEVTQSLYIAQASLFGSLYGDGFRNHAMPEAADIAVGGLPGGGAEERAVQTIELPRAYRCELYPWWRVDDPLRQQYDVIASHANLAEMHEKALAYYVGAWRQALAPGGCILIQDTGHAVLTKNSTVFEAIGRAGFRVLAKVAGKQGKRTLFGWNLLLVGEGHPDYAAAQVMREGQIFMADHPVVRSVFRLDRAAGRKVTVADLRKTLNELVAQYYGPAG